MIAVKYLLLCTALLAWLSVIGYPLRRLLDRPAGTSRPGAGALHRDGGRAGGRVVLVRGGTKWSPGARHRADRGCSRRVRRHRGSGPAPPPAGRPSATVHLRGRSYLGAAVVIGINFSAVLGLGYLTTADSGNNDAINYAMVADHLVRSELRRPTGRSSATTWAKRRASDGFGSTVVLGSFAALIGADTVQAQRGGALHLRGADRLFAGPPARRALPAAGAVGRRPSASRPPAPCCSSSWSPSSSSAR